MRTAWSSLIWKVRERSSTEPAELIAVFVADDGATLTTFIE